MGFRETGDSSIFFLKRILCGESYPGLLPRAVVFSFASKLRKGNLKTKWAKKVPQGSFSNGALVRSFGPRQVGQKRLAKTFINRGNYYTFLTTFNPEASQCSFLNQIHTTFAAGSKEDGPVRREPRVNYLGMQRAFPHLDASLLCRECISLQHGHLRAAVLAQEIKRGGSEKQPPIQLW